MSRAPFGNRFDRRVLLAGAGGMLAFPMLETLSPRLARGQTAAAPKRLLIVYNPDGRLIGNGSSEDGYRNDWWSPATKTGPIPAGVSKMLAPLDSIRDEIVTFDGIDNLIRHTNCCEEDQHIPAEQACLTCTAVDGNTVVAPSFDYVLGTRLRANNSMRPSIVVLSPAIDETWRAGNTAVFFGSGGSQPYIIQPDPAAAISELFGGVVVDPDMTPPPTPTLKERLVSSRKSVLDGVLGNFKSLRGRVNAADGARLDAHADFIRALEQRAGSPMTSMPGQGCTIPDASKVPSNLAPGGGTYQRGEKDGEMMPYVVENIVQAFACDVTRVASLFFFNGDDPIFPTQFPAGESPFDNNNWHTVIHGVPRINENTKDADDLTASYGFYGSTFTQLVKRLAEVTDVDGSRLLDNTLVLWVSEMGYGSVHVTHDIPVVMAGMKSAFPSGQGRHVVQDRRSMGDMLAHVMRMFGGDDMTFGSTGTIGDYNTDNIHADAGADGFITKDTPLHLGELDV